MCLYLSWCSLIPSQLESLFLSLSHIVTSLWYLELLDAQLVAVLLGTGQHVVEGIVVFVLHLLPLHLLLYDLLHVGVKDFSGFDPLDTEPNVNTAGENENEFLKVCFTAMNKLASW